MVRVIKYGRRKIKCENCDSLLEYTQSDVKSLEGSFTYAKYIECPVCEKRNIIVWSFEKF